MSIADFIKQHEAEAMSLNLSEYESINQVLQKYVFMLENAELDSERKEVSEFAGKAIKDLKKRLHLHLKNEGKAKYTNMIPPYLWKIRLLIEYRKLYNEATTSTPEPQQTEKGKKDKEPTKKDDYLLNIGLKLATGELDEYLIFNKDGNFKGAEKKYSEISRETNLDYQHLKCTLSDSTDQSNKSKNLRYNPEIIEKVLTHLKSEGKEPKEWFLKEFKK